MPYYILEPVAIIFAYIDILTLPYGATEGALIRDISSNEKQYINAQLSNTWKALQLVHTILKDKEQSHMEDLKIHYAARRRTTKAMVVKHILQSDATRQTAAKHKRYMK